MSDTRDWNPVRKGDIYCSPACGASCTYEAFEKATKDAEALAKRCEKEIGGVWKPRVHENLGWHWSVYQEGTNISIDYGGYLAQGTGFSVGFYGGTPSQVFIGRQHFDTPAEAYNAQIEEIKNEAARWNDILTVVTANTHTK